MRYPEGVHNIYINMQYDSPTPLPILSTTTECQCQLLQLVTKSIPWVRELLNASSAFLLPMK